MDKNVEVQIKYDKSDIRKAITFYLNKINKLWIVLSCFLVVILGFIIYAFFHGFDSGINTNIVIYALCAYVFYLFYYLIPTNRYIEFYNKRKGGIYTFSESDIRAIGEDIQTTYSWRVLKKAYEIPNAFLFLDENRFIYVFPKRCFENEENINKLRTLVSENIKVFEIYA